MTWLAPRDDAARGGQVMVKGRQWSTGMELLR
ncbi:hypothetical protein PAJL_745 [Cutibacterium acnes HL042PA3]|nr:hypothetical protein TIIST44_10845 [Cutibacterium acnes subsp. defendens ATCC 11828]AID36948.1 hypothetical protein TIA1EST1_03645 [Cutibacterium acnes hdn-1]ESK60145.1 hypothetical protein PAJL_745 [Cutibacterium acnes HL042PA3]ESS85919.1 hypothetical protein H498_10573 [Cutibacterium acnes P6]KFC14621.1 hypothetical protein PAST2_04545 [Cutibacterium acnes HL202PA1]MCM4175213.1 hypothetical protein [Cutibacterium acnes P06A]MCM4180615.1 hypothetical protein [Cutibacterium acnes P15]MCM4